jgi:hypothetical protein
VSSPGYRATTGSEARQAKIIIATCFDRSAVLGKSSPGAATIRMTANMITSATATIRKDLIKTLDFAAYCKVVPMRRKAALSRVYENQS